MDVEAEIKKLWEQNSKLWALQDRIKQLEAQMAQLDEMVLSNPGYGAKK